MQSMQRSSRQRLYESSEVEALMSMDEIVNSIRKAQTCLETCGLGVLCWPFNRVFTRGSHVPGINRQDRGVSLFLGLFFFFFLFFCLLSPLAPRPFF
jgi:hypothetical protein